MPLRLLRYCLCLVVLGCAGTPSSTGRAQAGSEVPACTPGELLFAPSYLPLDLVLTPEGRSLLVVDRGFLALRDVSTLKVQRYLLPQVDGWASASLSPDGRTLTAQTFDGQRYAFDTTTWKAERLPDVRVLKHEREEADMALITGSGVRLGSLMKEALPPLTDVMKDPELIREMTQKQMFPLAVALDAPRQRMLIGETKGALSLLDIPGQRIVKRVPCENCPPYVSLSADAEGFLGVTAAGQLRVLDRELNVVREVAFLPPEQVQGEAEPRTRFVRRLLRVGDGSRVAWLTRDHELGLFDLATGTHVLRMPALGVGGLAMAALLDARRVALLSEGTLRVWDMLEQRVLVEKPGPYASAVRLDADQWLATREDGTAELVSSRSGEVLRSFCATQRPCERDRAAFERLLKRTEELEGEDAEALLAEPRRVPSTPARGAARLAGPADSGRPLVSHALGSGFIDGPGLHWHVAPARAGAPGHACLHAG
ncbi:WD40 repeat domain-containing protein [Archangium gephyra]|uniref:WD40 repeat domain-containing protein n=1 Tax=Archangium gephyra TaxID=48 RepID=UPI003B78DA47